MDKSTLEKINSFTRRKFTEKELYVFPVTLCDNDIDRDGESFSDEALESLKSLFVGKTGIFDHDPKGTNQSARIFDTELVTDSERKTATGEPYRYLKGWAYMIRTDSNKSLIDEIDGGIKKEVSVSCSANKKICSICGCDVTKEPCEHQKFKEYDGKICHFILDDVTDAYEWSFVAVPAQVNAGVSKKYNKEDKSMDFEAITSQEQLDKIVNAKVAESTADIQKQLDKANLDLIRLRTVTEKGIPSEFADRLNGSTEEEIKADAEKISKFFDGFTHQPVKRSTENVDEISGVEKEFYAKNPNLRPEKESK